MKQGKLAIEILIILIVVTFTAALILFLVKSGVVDVEEGEDVNFLNTEYITGGREGSLTIQDFSFCISIDDQNNCEFETTNFQFSEEIYFLTSIKSSTVNNQIQLIENYQIKDPNGEIIYDVNQREDFIVEDTSSKKEETIPITDSFAINFGDEGEYTLDLIISNPLLNKQTTFNIFIFFVCQRNHI